jgi:hypothetical protein
MPPGLFHGQAPAKAEGAILRKAPGGSYLEVTLPASADPSSQARIVLRRP